MRFVKELYLSIFVLFFRFSFGERSWVTAMKLDAHKAIVGISIVAGLLLLGVSGWINIHVAGRLDIDLRTVSIAEFAIFSANYYFLIGRGIGIDFEKKFDEFGERKQTLLQALSLTIVVGVLGFAFFLIHIVRDFALRGRLPSTM